LFFSTLTETFAPIEILSLSLLSLKIVSLDFWIFPEFFLAARKFLLPSKGLVLCALGLAHSYYEGA
jgi:hypothetical protein